MLGAFVLTLIGLVTIGALRRNWAQAGTSLILLLDWAACTSVVLLTHDFYPVLFFLVADYLAALAIFAIRVSHWQSAVMVVSGLQLICHAAFALSDQGPAPIYYTYWVLSYLAWMQAALIGGWITYELIGSWVRSLRSKLSLAPCTSPSVAREKES